ncbi:MAG: acetyltransferase [Desulfovibrio sp.]|nr:acetyltransferase [Desulfovibrio sp.]
MKKKLIMIGCGGTAEMFADSFMASDEWEIAAFSVEKRYLRSSFMGRPVVAFENLEDLFSPEEYYFFVGIGENDLNRLRRRFYTEMRSRGWNPASYISPRASVSARAKLGEHCFVSDNVVIQTSCRAGNNVIFLPNCYIAHHSEIGDNVFCAGGANISGFARIGEFSFIGANAAVSTCVSVGRNCLVGIGGVCSRDLADNEALVAPYNTVRPDAREIFNIWHAKTSAKARAALNKRDDINDE